MGMGAWVAEGMAVLDLIRMTWAAQEEATEWVVHTEVVAWVEWAVTAPILVAMALAVAAAVMEVVLDKVWEQTNSPSDFRNGRIWWSGYGRLWRR